MASIYCACIIYCLFVLFKASLSSFQVNKGISKLFHKCVLKVLKLKHVAKLHEISP